MKSHRPPGGHPPPPSVPPGNLGPLVRAARKDYQKPNLIKKPRFRPGQLQSPPPPGISGIGGDA